MNKFKVGDKVYFPFESNRVLTVQENYDDDPNYLIKVDGFLLNTDGKYTDRDPVPSVVPATPEKHALLEALFEVKFEKPPAKPTSREIIQAMLARGDKSVCCWVSESDEYPTSSYHWVFICSVSDDVFIDDCDAIWKYATPFDHKTEQPITELPT